MRRYVERVQKAVFLQRRFSKPPPALFVNTGLPVHEYDYDTCIFSKEVVDVTGNNVTMAFIALWMFPKCLEELDPDPYCFRECNQDDFHEPCSCRRDYDEGTFFCYPINAYWTMMHDFDRASVYEVDPEYVANHFKATLIAGGMTEADASTECYVRAYEWYVSVKKQFNEVNQDNTSRKKASNKMRREKNGDNTNSKRTEAAKLKKQLKKK